MITKTIEYKIEILGSVEIKAASIDEAYEKYNEISWQELIDSGSKSEQYDIYEASVKA